MLYHLLYNRPDLAEPPKPVGDCGTPFALYLEAPPYLTDDEQVILHPELVKFAAKWGADRQPKWLTVMEAAHHIIDDGGVRDIPWGRYLALYDLDLLRASLISR